MSAAYALPMRFVCAPAHSYSLRTRHINTHPSPPRLIIPPNLHGF
ncbi:hypothetical protein L13192_12161 [Pyrenophora tritici-repentis]|nr:hypothetical protein L13192_12161 [Pyrenophora tritici-repentis]